MKIQDINKQIGQLPELISLTQLRFQTKKLQDWLSKHKIIILTARSKKIGLITTLNEHLEKKNLPCPPAYNMGKFKTSLRRVDFYKDYYKKKYNVNID